MSESRISSVAGLSFEKVESHEEYWLNATRQLAYSEVPASLIIPIISLVPGTLENAL